MELQSGSTVRCENVFHDVINTVNLLGQKTGRVIEDLFRK